MVERFMMLAGVNVYANPDVPTLSSCADDARAMAAVLSEHEDGTPNFVGSPLIDEAASRGTMLTVARALFEHPKADVLFYFSGHGVQMPKEDGYLVTHDATASEPGLSMTTLLTLANSSPARSRLIILDCCHAGQFGDPLLLGDGNTILHEGVTILAAAAPDQEAMEVDGKSVFTRLLLAGLNGGAADLRGRVSAAALYAFAEKALGEREQRPYYKSYARTLDPVRLCHTGLSAEVLKRLTDLFPNQTDHYILSPAHEPTNPRRNPAAVADFNLLKLYRNGGLLALKDDLYWCAINGISVGLNGLGKYYWQLAKSELL